MSFAIDTACADAGAIATATSKLAGLICSHARLVAPMNQ